MLIEEVVENVTPIFGKKGNKTVRKYRCTSGSRKGRIVAKPSTCTAPKNVAASNTMKKTRRSKASSQATKTRITKRSNPASKRLKSYNTGRRRIKPNRGGKKRSKI
jgi:hypothetical protein